MREGPNRIRVLLVDDHAVVRMGYRTLLEHAEDIEVVAEASSGEAACRKYAEVQPDVVIMDLSLAGMSGLEAIRRIIGRDPKARILVFSMYEDMIFVERSLQTGARGYLPKSCAPEIMIKAVQRIARGDIYLDAELAQRLAYQKIRGRDTPFLGLSSREFEIFCLLAEGLNTSQIARRLSLSYKTVANYSTQIKHTLQVETQAELVRLAIRHGVMKA